jgi:CRISPR-associated protein Csm4
MRTYRATIVPLAAFGTPLKADTFFGQLCWAVRNRFGEARLAGLLQGYTSRKPFAVVSDAFPSGYLPRPTLPGHWFDEVPNEDRKAMKKGVWMPLERFDAPLCAWLAHCRAAKDLPDAEMEEHPQPHNTIDRTTGMTGKGAFAPYAMTQLWHGRKGNSAREPLVEARLDFYVVLDEARLATDDLGMLLNDIGVLGFGRDASIGLGKFRVDALEPFDLPEQVGADARLTLAPCAPQGLKWDAGRSFYTVFTRFGRHGDIGVHHGNPFKAPVLLVHTGAVLTPKPYQRELFTGRGLGGDGSLSKAIPNTVHQGYAPVAGIRLPEGKEPL